MESPCNGALVVRTGAELICISRREIEPWADTDFGKLQFEKVWSDGLSCRSEHGSCSPAQQIALRLYSNEMTQPFSNRYHFPCPSNSLIVQGRLRAWVVSRITDTVSVETGSAECPHSRRT